MSCFQLVISSLLKKTKKKFQYIWFESGTKLIIDKNNFRITPYFKDFNKLVEEQLNLKFNKIRIENLNLLENIDFNTKEYKGLGIKVDTHELPYCMYYKDQHNIHMIELINYNSEYANIIDHYYQFKGEIKKEHLFNAAISVNKHFENDCSELFWFESIDNKTIKTINFEELLMSNYQMLRGNFNKEYNENVKKDNIEYIGLEALQIFKNEVMCQLKNYNEIKLINQMMDKLSLMIKDMSNSRRLFRDLIYFHYSKPELKSLEDELLEASIMWNILSNLILLTRIKSNYNYMLDRIESRINLLIEQEHKVVNLFNGKIGT
ncbi:hypothetical protein [Bacillus velezensis]|uniref:hypothetical protein n=1 Tax=Bacillus velezensis TaxID=492670 RepID=UPI0039AFE9C7